MTSESLTQSQLDRLESAFHIGADDASVAMARWLSVPSLITIESVEQQPVSEATGLLGEGDNVVCFCVMAINGTLTGHLILSFDEASGMSLADLLLDQPAGTASEWGDVEQSAALESHNIIGCAYLNSLAKHLPAARRGRFDENRNREEPDDTNRRVEKTGFRDPPLQGESLELVPSPPEFRRDFAESLLQAVFMDQALAGDLIFVAKARFELRGRPLHWTLLFVPDAPSMSRLRQILSADESQSAGASE